MAVELVAGLDFRRPEYRREVFLRFYEFHTKYRSHPGGVYYLMPYFVKRGEWTPEQRLWFAFVNGNTLSPVTSYIIFQHFPVLAEIDIHELADWFKSPSVYARLSFGTDRRFHKKSFVESVACYQEQLGGKSQWDFFSAFCKEGEEHANFQRIWDKVQSSFLTFGRVSSYSYLEFLRIMGLDLDCDQLFLDDRAGSRSHRNGLCKVIGRDDLDWHSSNPGFDGLYAEDVIDELETFGASLLSDAKARAAGKPWERDIGYFTLESALCNYMKWHRHASTYPNVYNDVLFERIQYAESQWFSPSMDIFWEARAASLPPNLLMERNPRDAGNVPLKQNHYKQTGQVIMMERDWDCFQNDYGRRRLQA